MIRNTLKWLLPVVLAVAFVAAPSVFAQVKYEPVPAGNKADRRQHRGEVQYQRQQLRQINHKLRAEARRSGHRKPPKAEQHHLSKAHQHSIRQTTNLRRARKQNRRRRTVHHQANTN